MNKNLNINPHVWFNEIKKKVYVQCIDDYGDDIVVSVDVIINDSDKTVRIKRIPDKIKQYCLSQIVFAIIEKCVLPPTNKYSIEKLIGNVGTYTLIVEGCLLNGFDRKRGNNYPSIITDFIDNIPESPLEPVEMTVYRNKVKDVYNSLDKIKASQNMIIVFKGKGRRLKASNTAIILNHYLRDKGYEAYITQENDFTNTKLCVYAKRKAK